MNRDPSVPRRPGHGPTPEQPLFDERTPIYRQVADQVREAVLAGALGPDEQVMSTNQYAAFHRINPATVAKAFQRLVDEGLLYKRRGIGMFVTPGAAEQLRAQRRAGFVETVLVPTVAEADRLGIPRAELIEAIHSLSPLPQDGNGGAPADDSSNRTPAAPLPPPGQAGRGITPDTGATPT